MLLFRCCSSLLFVVTSLGAQVPAIALTGGAAAPGQLDPDVTYLMGPPAAGFGAPFTTADFQIAQTGSQAQVRSAIAGGWPLQLPMDPSARWIDTQNGSASALYAIGFTVAQPTGSAVLTLQFSADDALGDPIEPGVYVNEVPVAGTTNIGGYYFIETIQRDISGMLLPGQNWLYLYLYNTGGAGGLLFTAEVQVDGGMVASYGQGCVGSAGTPLMLAAAPSTLPGATATLSLYSLPLGAPVALVLGSDDTTSFGAATPADLGFLGFPGCSGLLEPVALVVILSSGGGAQFALPLPGPQFLGVSLFSQGFVFDAQHPRGASVTNGIELRTGY